MTPKPILGEMIVNGQAELVARALDDGWFEYRSGKMPDDMEREPPTETLLARGKMAPVSFSTARDGVITANKAERVQAIRSGEPTYVRFVSPAGRLVFAGTVGTKDANFVGAAKGMIEGQFVDITGIRYAVPKTF